MTRQLSGEEFGQLFWSIQQSAFRLELQRSYLEPSETEMLSAYLDGSDRYLHLQNDDLKAWWELLREHCAHGRTVERVRVQEDPPTPYQEWERWIGRWNTTAGELTRYMTRAQAHEVGLLPAAGDQDWWLLDSAQLVIMTFDREGRRIGTELTDETTIVEQACEWRDLAILHSTPSTDRA